MLTVGVALVASLFGRDVGCFICFGEFFIQGYRGRRLFFRRFAARILPATTRWLWFRVGPFLVPHYFKFRCEAGLGGRLRAFTCLSFLPLFKLSPGAPLPNLLSRMWYMTTLTR